MKWKASFSNYFFSVCFNALLDLPSAVGHKECSNSFLNGLSLEQSTWRSDLKNACLRDHNCEAAGKAVSCNISTPRGYELQLWCLHFSSSSLLRHLGKAVEESPNSLLSTCNTLYRACSPDHSHPCLTVMFPFELLQRL